MARGSTVGRSGDALVKAIRSGAIAGGLNVFEAEPKSAGGAVQSSERRIATLRSQCHPETRQPWPISPVENLALLHFAGKP